MRIAVISDIHSNLLAFEQVLADIDVQQVDAMVCLGDTIGYGPEPEETTTLLRQRGIPSVMGNHEYALIEESYFRRLNPVARESLALTRSLLTRETITYIRTLPPVLRLHDALFVHGVPPDSMTRYLFQTKDEILQKACRAMVEKICFVGHTHLLEFVLCTESGVERQRLKEGVFELPGLGEKDSLIINVGSIGQPRDESTKSKYVIWDKAAATIKVRHITYDAKKTARQILNLGFPKSNASWLL